MSSVVMYVLLTGLCIAAWCGMVTAVPGELPLTLKILSDGTPYTGSVDIKFAVIEKNSEQVHWTNDGSMEDPPQSGVSAEAINGRCSVKLGDTVMHSLPPELFSTTNTLLLRIYLRVDTNDVFEILNPDMPFEAEAYSFMAYNAAHLGGRTEYAFVSTGMVDQLYLSVSALAGDLEKNTVENRITHSNVYAIIDEICMVTNSLQKQVIHEQDARRADVAELKTNILDITAFITAADTNILDMISLLSRTTDIHYISITKRLVSLSNTVSRNDTALSNLIGRTAGSFYSTSIWQYTCLTNSLAVFSNSFRRIDMLLSGRITGLSNQLAISEMDFSNRIENTANAFNATSAWHYMNLKENISFLSNKLNNVDRLLVNRTTMLSNKINTVDWILSNRIEDTRLAFNATTAWQYIVFTNVIAALSNRLDGTSTAVWSGIAAERAARETVISNLSSDTSINVIILSNRIVTVKNAVMQYVDSKVFTSNQIGTSAVTSDKIDDQAVLDRHIDAVAADKITAAPWVDRTGDIMTGILTTKGLVLFGTAVPGYTVSGAQAHPQVNGFYRQAGMCGDFPLYQNQSNCVLYMTVSRHTYAWHIGLSTNNVALYDAIPCTSPVSPTAGWPAGIAVAEDTMVIAPEIDMGRGYLRNLGPAEHPGEAVTFEQLDSTMAHRQARENELESMIDMLYTYVRTCTTGLPPERFMDAVGSEIDFSNYLTVTNGTMVSGYLTLANQPYNDMHAATKQYVDVYVAASVSNVPGTFAGPVHAWSRGGQTIVTCPAVIEGRALPSAWQSFTLPHDSRLKHIALQPNPGTGADFLHVQLFAGLPQNNNHICEFYLDWWPGTVNLHFNNMALTAGVYSIKCQYLDSNTNNILIGLKGTYTAMNDPYPNGSYCGMSDFDAWLEINYNLDTSTIGEGTPDNNLGSNGLYVTGGIEIDQAAFFDGDVLIKGSNINDIFLRKNISDAQTVQGPITVAANGDWTVGAPETRSDIVIKHAEGMIRADNGDLALDAGNNTIVACSQLVLDTPQAGKAAIPAGESGVQIGGIPVTPGAVIIVTPCQAVEGVPFVDVHPDGTFTVGLPYVTDETVILNYVVLKN